MRFHRNKAQPDTTQYQEESLPGATAGGGRKMPRWVKLSLYANIAIVAAVVLLAAGGYVVHQSDTNPSLCATCHVMQPNVTSYLTGNSLDNVHQQAGVGCKGCHDYPLSAEIDAGIKFLTGNYAVDPSGNVLHRTFGDDMCLQCHISYEHIAQQTDFLLRNPHNNHNGQLACNACHVSHGQQIDFCSTCHDNGGQRLVGEPIVARNTILASSGSQAAWTSVLGDGTYTIPHDLLGRDDCLSCHGTSASLAPALPQDHIDSNMPNATCRACHLPTTAAATVAPMPNAANSEAASATPHPGTPAS